MYEFEEFLSGSWGKLLACLGILVVAEFTYNLIATRVIRTGENPIAVLEQRLETCKEIPDGPPVQGYQYATHDKVEQCFDTAWTDLREQVGTYKIACNIDGEGSFGMSRMSGEIPGIEMPWYYDPGPGFLLSSSCRNFPTIDIN